MHQYRVYIDEQIQGPYDVKDLLAVKGFSESSLVCEVGENEWLPAKQVRAIRSQLSPSSSTLVEEIAPRPASTVLKRFHSKPPKEIIQTGDFISPNYQFDTPGRRSTNFRPLSNKFRVIDLPQPAKHSKFRRLMILTLLILGSSLWTVHSIPDIPGSFKVGWQTLRKMTLNYNVESFLRLLAPKYTPTRKK